MSDVQFKAYEAARVEERKLEKKKPKQNVAEDYEEKTSTYRIFSRLFCNFIIPDRPIPSRQKKKEEEKDEGEGKDDEKEESNIVTTLKQGKKVESKQDIQHDKEGEIEGDEVLEDIGGITYKERLQNKLKEMEDN